MADNDDTSEDLDKDNIADDELQDLSDIDLVDIDNDEDLSDMEFNDSDDGEVLDDELISDLNKKLKNSKSKEKKKGRGIDSDIFVSAEKFAEMLEEQSKSRGKHGSSNTFNSSDGASVKQIDWEMKRDQRLKGSFSKNKRKSAQFNNKQVKRSKR